MPIEVKHSVGAGPVAAAAYGGGQGQARSRIKQQQLDNEARKRAQASHEAFQSEMADKSNAQALERQTASNEQRADLREEAAVALGTRTAEQHERDDQSAQKREREDSPDFEYTQQQQQDNSRLDEEEHAIRTDESLTDDEKADGLRQIADKRRRIMPTRIAKKKSPYAEGQGKGQVWDSPDGRTQRTRDDKGNVKDLPTGLPTPADVNKRYEIVIKANTTEETGKVDWAEVKKQMSLYEKGETEKPPESPATGNTEDPATQPAADAPAENLAYKDVDNVATPASDDDLLAVADAVLKEDTELLKRLPTEVNGETSYEGLEWADAAKAQRQAAKLVTQKMRVINQMMLRKMPPEKWTPIYNTMTEDQKQKLTAFMAQFKRTA